MIKIDMESAEFKEALAKTKEFTDKVCASKGWVYNPIDDVNEGVTMGLARNKMIYNKRFCPCFPVEEKDGKYVSSDNRICPCPQAIKEEIPNKGVCHCGIFCTPEFAKNYSKEHPRKEAKEIEGLSVSELEKILEKDQILGEELEILLKAREKGLVNFKLIDIREPFEYQMMRIKGTDKLLPISRVQYDLDEWMKLKDERIIIYCHVGSRSGYLQRALQQQLGFDKVGNLTYGIADYPGEIERG